MKWTWSLLCLGLAVAVLSLGRAGNGYPQSQPQAPASPPAGSVAPPRPTPAVEKASPETGSGAGEAAASKMETPKPPQAVSPPGMNLPATAGRQIEVSVNLANVREGPSTSHPVVARVTEGERFTPREEKSGWYRITLSGGRGGWIYGDLTRPAQEPRAAASSSAAATPGAPLMPPRKSPQEDSFARGNQLYLEGKFEAAIVQFEEALKETPQNPDVLYNLALAYEDAGRLDDALTTYNRVLNLEPTYVPALVNLGRLYFRGERLEAAAAQWKRALQINPLHASAHYNLAIAYERLDPGKAIEQWQKFLSVSENNPAQSKWRRQAEEHLTYLRTR